MGFDEQQLLVNLINRKGFILCHHSPINANVLLSLRTARPAGPRHATPRPRPQLGEASERARVWFTDLLLPVSQVVYTRSTL